MGVMFFQMHILQRSVQVDRREEATEWFIKAVAADKDNIGIPPAISRFVVFSYS